jgi:hypothetical protein
VIVSRVGTWGKEQIKTDEKEPICHIPDLAVYCRIILIELRVEKGTIIG